jgi:anti-sigma factor RsiW
MMPCDFEAARLAAYLDGEVTAEQAAAVKQHIAGCSACAAEVAEMVALKRGLREARAKFAPSAEFRARMMQQVVAKKPRARMGWLWPALGALAAVLVLTVVGWIHFAQHADGFGEVADLHVNMLASANPLDVVSSDRHTVKPWFQGRIPFSFNVPEFGGSEFTLLGGKMVYLHQQPGAQLIVARGQHRISVLILQDSTAMEREFPAHRGVAARDGFNVEAWRMQGLQFVVVGDADPAAIWRLSEMLGSVNRGE